jgi:hypothetical protein
MYYARDTSYDFIGFPLHLKGVVLKTWMSFHILCKGTVRISWVYICLEGAPLGINFHGSHKVCKAFHRVPSGFHSVFIYFTINGFCTFCRGAPCEVIKLAYIIQGVLLNMSEDFQNTFCKGHPLGFHWIPIWSSLATPIILQWVPLRINFVVSIHFARVPLLTISSDLLSFWKKRWSSRYQWSSIYFAGDTLWFHSVSICLQGGGGTP